MLAGRIVEVNTEVGYGMIKQRGKRQKSLVFFPAEAFHSERLDFGPQLQELYVVFESFDTPRGPRAGLVRPEFCK